MCFHKNAVLPKSAEKVQSREYAYRAKVPRKVGQVKKADVSMSLCISKIETKANALVFHPANDCPALNVLINKQAVRVSEWRSLAVE